MYVVLCDNVSVTWEVTVNKKEEKGEVSRHVVVVLIC